MSQYIPSAAIIRAPTMKTIGNEDQPGIPEERSAKAASRPTWGSFPLRCPATMPIIAPVMTMAPIVAPMAWPASAPPAEALLAASVTIPSQGIESLASYENGRVSAGGGNNRAGKTLISITRIRADHRAALGSAPGRARASLAARGPRDGRGDHRHHPPRGPRVRPAVAGQLRPGDPAGGGTRARGLPRRGGGEARSRAGRSARRVRRARPRRGARGAHNGGAAGRLQGGSARGLALRVSGGAGGGLRPRHARPARGGRIRLHRPALRPLGRRLRRGAVRRRGGGGTPQAGAPHAARAAAPGGADGHRRRGARGGLGASAVAGGARLARRVGAA